MNPAGEGAGTVGADGNTPAVDHQELEALLAERGLSTSTDEPRVTTWLRDVVERGVHELRIGLSPSLGDEALLVGGVVLAALAVLAAVLVVRLLRLLRNRPRTPAPAQPQAVLLPMPSSTPSREAIEARLLLGDGQGALRDLWRWVAAHVEALGLAHPAPDRTNRELLAEVRRADPRWERLPAFSSLTNAVDGLLYGGERCDADAVRRLLPLADKVVL
jgi:Domain of unknown function (DUF4129)